MAKLEIKTDQVPIRVDSGGAVRVGPTRVTLRTVLGSYKRGESPEEIVESFPTLKLADVYSVIGYYLNHQVEVDAYLQQAERDAAESWRKIEALPGHKEFRKRLRALFQSARETRA